MKKMVVYLLIAAVLVSSVFAWKSFCTPKPAGFKGECAKYYNSDEYYSIAKFEYKNWKYQLAEKNPAYSYYDIKVKGLPKIAKWTSTPEVHSVLVKAGKGTTAAAGGSEGVVKSEKDISHLTFCGKKQPNGGGGNGVPEFSTMAVGAAVLAVALGLVFIRRR
jgi:hypothetical protein